MIRTHGSRYETLRCAVGFDVDKISALLRKHNLLHWYTQNYDLVSSPNKRVGYAGGDVGKCIDAISKNRSHDVPWCMPGDNDIYSKVII